ncbi:nitrile hydratase subunit beta [Bradyrhizobium sp. PMVTL-01]|jgi:nitrile hydratase beta subunit|uniref:nitrile hydratase subunit beta n=1 Tax=Bradyrhizobium sp. PMVTL-01 TaxID=3434999 RepID=UPI003F708778
MNGPHDLGGKSGFGEVSREANEPAFHHHWEGLAWALNMLAITKLRAYKPDTYRHAVERMTPSWYLAARYYERMLTGVTTLLVEKGTVSLDDLEHRAGGRVPLSDPVAALQVLQTENSEAPEARFSPGDAVRVIAEATPGHTRCPTYVRGKQGVIRLVYPLAYYPELRAHSTVKRREHSYAVEFAATHLWNEGDPAQTVLVELFESYLEAQ